MRGPAFFANTAFTVVTLNPSDKSADITLSGGNLTATKGGTAALRSVRATKGIDAASNGYFEVRRDEAGENASGGVAPYALVGLSTTSLSVSSYVGADTNGWGYYQENGNKVTNAVQTAYGAAWAVDGDVIMVAFKAGKIWFGKNGTWQASGDPAAGTNEAYSGLTGTLFPTISLYKHTGVPHVATARFKSSSFSYSPPSGFSAWES